MYFVYILQSGKDNSLYIGYSSNLKIRFLTHKNGKVKSTKNKRPLKLIYYESFINSKDAKEREKYLKTGWGWRSIKKILKNTLKKSS